METLLALTNIDHGVGTIRAGVEFKANSMFAKQLMASGQAVKIGTRLVWEKLHWPHSHVVCIASGPSLTQEDCDAVRVWRDGGSNRRVIVINTSYKAAPWADLLYASDEGWWNNYHVRVEHEFNGLKFTSASIGDPFPPHIGKYGLQHVPLERGSGLNKKPGIINSGSNSGYQTIGVAFLAGATRVTLLGYDMSAESDRHQHWHPEHPWWYNNHMRAYREWANMFPKLHDDLRSYGVTLVNASRQTAIRVVPRVSLEQALA